jgi:outer membrane receptor protein involved in Fe transport
MAKPLTWGVLLATTFAIRASIAQEAADAPVVEKQAAEADIDVPGGAIIVLGSAPGSIQRTTTQVVSVLTNEDIARTGDGDIAGALGRVAGLTVVGDGFVYVRGLGDRYSLALLNGSPLPSPEPLRRAVPLDLFPTDVIASSLVQKTYSPNFSGEFGGGVINLTTLNIPKAGFLNVSFSGSGDTETTGQLGYNYFGSDTDWTGYGNRDLPPALKSFFASRERMSAGNVDTGTIARELVTPDDGLVQKVGEIPANFSGSITGGDSWVLGNSELGFVATAGYNNKWRTRDNVEQTPGNLDLSTTNKDYHTIETSNRIISNAMLGVGYQFGDGNNLRWTNLYVHDTLKQTGLSQGQWNVTYTGWDFLEQSTAQYERELISSQLSGGFRLDPVNIDARVSYSHSKRESPYELDIGYARDNIAADPYGAFFMNRLSGQNRNYANIAFSDLNEDLWSGGAGVTWPIRTSLSLSAGYEYTYTQRDSARREFQIRAPSTFPSAIGLLRPDYLLGPAVVDYYDVGLIETTETDPAFAAQLRVHAGYLQAQAELVEGLELSAGARYEHGQEDVRPEQVFTTLTNSGASTSLSNDYLLPAATLTWKFAEDQQLRFNVSKTIARPQFRELMFQKYSDPESNRDYLGNPLLTDGEFVNAEARYEWYFAYDQRFAVAGFYKDINKPIEAYTTYPEGDSPVTSYANAPSAQLYGAEFEAQKYFLLGDVSSSTFLASRRAVVIGNYTYSKSKIHVGANDTVEIYGSNQTTRAATDYFTDGSPLTGQSDHVVNLQFGLEKVDSMSQQTILFSYASDRVTSRAGGASPDIVEAPGLRVDFVARQGFSFFGQDSELKLEVRNIFGQGYKEFQQLDGNTIYYNRYDVGTTFGASFEMRF